MRRVLIKSKRHATTSVGAEEALNKRQLPFMTETKGNVSAGQASRRHCAPREGWMLSGQSKDRSRTRMPAGATVLSAVLEAWPGPSGKKSEEKSS